MRNKLAQQIKHSLSLKLSLSILAFTVIIFMITIGIIFFRSRHFVRQTAIDCAKNTEGAITYYVRYNPDFAYPTSGIFAQANDSGSYDQLTPTDFTEFDKNDTSPLSLISLPIRENTSPSIPSMKTDTLRLSRKEVKTMITSTWLGIRSPSAKARPAGWIPSATTPQAPPTI